MKLSDEAPSFQNVPQGHVSEATYAHSLAYFIQHRDPHLSTRTSPDAHHYTTQTAECGQLSAITSAYIPTPRPACAQRIFEETGHEHSLWLYKWRCFISSNVFGRITLRKGRGCERNRLLSQWRGHMLIRGLYRMCGRQQRRPD